MGATNQTKIFTEYKKLTQNGKQNNNKATARNLGKMKYIENQAIKN